MNKVIVDDLKISNIIPFYLFFFIWELAILYALFIWQVVHSLKDMALIIFLLILPIFIFISIYKEICIIIYNVSDKCISIRHCYKQTNIHLELIKKIEIRYGEQFVGDSGPSYYEMLVLFGIDDKVLFSYKSKDMNVPDELIMNTSIEINYIEEN